jgi:hypothetical protein
MNFSREKPGNPFSRLRCGWDVAKQLSAPSDSGKTCGFSRALFPSSLALGHAVVPRWRPPP